MPLSDAPRTQKTRRSAGSCDYLPLTWLLYFLPRRRATRRLALERFMVGALCCGWQSRQVPTPENWWL